MSRPEPSRRGAFRHWTRASTRWSDNDVYGHVNNVIYYQWFDSAVNAWMIDHGLLNVETGDPIALVVETRCTYFASIAFPGSVEIGLRAAAVGGSSIRYHIGIFAEGGQTAVAEGEFVHVVVARDTRRPVHIPDKWRTALDGIS